MIKQLRGVIKVTELKEVPEEELSDEEKKFLRGKSEGVNIKKKDSSNHCVCNEKGDKITSFYDPESFSLFAIIDEAGKNEAQENPDIT